MSRLRLLLLLSASFSCSSEQAPSPSPGGTLESRVVSVLDSADIGAASFPAAIVAVLEGDAVRVHRARGVDGAGAAIDPDARGRIGSVTKAFVGLAVRRVVESGRWSLATPLAELLPDVTGLDGITVGHALAHTSGLADLIDDSLFEAIVEAPDRVWTDAELAARGLAKRRVGAPGERFVYANTNYHLLGMALQRAEGKSMAQLLEAEVIGPLGLRDTRYPTGAALPPPRLDGSLDGNVTTPIDPSYAGSAGAMDATALDLVRFGRALGRGELLATEGLRPAAHTYRDASDLGVPDLEYGLGVMRIDGWYGHAGDVLGYGSVVLHQLERDRTVAVLATGDFGNAFFLGVQLARALDAQAE